MPRKPLPVASLFLAPIESGRDAIARTRAQLDAERDVARAATSLAHSVGLAARGTLAELDRAQTAAEGDLAAIAILAPKIADAALVADSWAALAAASSTAAASAAVAVSAATAAIGGAVKAIDAVMIDVNDLFGITNSNDDSDVLNAAAAVATAVVAKVALALEDLKVMALNASVEAASSGAPGALVAAQTAQEMVVALKGAAASDRAARVEEMVVAQQARDAAAVRTRQAEVSYAMASATESALARTIKRLDATPKS